ncbi:MAG: helix-turn-helix domain-containing protein [Propionibacterium sp.]|nr:helix-turn-helix domain-containing protein [Propionibacterium sp.]
MDFDTRYAAGPLPDRPVARGEIHALRHPGIYCRPSCPARTPARRNVEFFPTSAAAQAAGYRACRRCLPEALPGSPEWDLREDLAARAMRLITQGMVDRVGVAGLAAHLGHSTRHLTRILTAELGAGPLALARAHRAHTARQLLCSTDLSASDIAFSAGFTSIRQFNDTIRAVFDLTPTQVRARAGRRELVEEVEQVPGNLTLRLAHRTPLDATGLFAWFATRAVPGIEEADTSHLRRSLRTAHGVALVDVSGAAGDLRAHLRLQDPADLPEVLGRVRRLCDLDADPEAVDEALAGEPAVTGQVRATPGVRIPGEFDLAECLTRAVIGQQVSVAVGSRDLAQVALTLAEPLSDSFLAGGHTEGGAAHGPHLLFPTAEALAEHATEVVPGPRRRGETIAGACRAIAEGSLSIDASWTRSDAVDALCALPGIGPWTADYVTLRILGAPDVLVRGDAALLRGARHLGLAGQRRELEERARGLAPWRSYLGMHLWRASTGKESRP